jgi:hypothetical protein
MANTRPTATCGGLQTLRNLLGHVRVKLKTNLKLFELRQKGKELNDFQRNPLDIEILSNLRFGSLEIRDTSVTTVTNNSSTVKTLGVRTITL